MRWGPSRADQGAVAAGGPGRPSCWARATVARAEAGREARAERGTGVIAATSSPPARTAVDPARRVVVVGAGPAGMATAIELAQRGVPSVVLEQRGATGTREPLFNVAPPFADRLAALDPEGSLTKLLVPVDRIEVVDERTGRVGAREFEGALAPDAARSRGDMGSLVDALDAHVGSAAADRRRWAMVGIGDLENGLRELARTKHADLIDLRPDSGVGSIRQGDGWAEAVLTPAADGAARDAVRGVMLVDASGRDLAGGPRTTWPERSFWLGARLPARTDGSRAIRRTRDIEPTTGAPRLTVELPSADRTLLWTQVPRDPTTVSADAAGALIAERAAAVGAPTPAAGARTMPVTVQLWTSDQPAVGRVLKVGDSVRGPYFMTSSGAATALVHDAPRAVDAITAVLDGAPLEATVGAYADAVRGANARLVDLVRPRLLDDLGVPRGEEQPGEKGPGPGRLRT
ncbi:MAG: 3-(3-hydroxy-phenyl)propionate hydroxylase [Thermoleophilia bacterium]|nr:3-(3-hydroxy-phenyl)propionate hydroxylase [Thermoleophilia bacterium]